MFQIITMVLIVLVSGCKKDDDPGVRPKVISTEPISNSTNKAVNSNITATFSVAMDPSTITDATFTLKKGTESVLGAVMYAGTTASFTPAANLASNTEYTATITSGAKDLAGVSLAKDYSWKFTTSAVPDVTRPTVTLTGPLNNATAVPLNQVIIATFSEPMNLSTITPLTFTVKQGSTSVLGAITYSGTTATFTPTNNLTANKTYTATISTGARDMAGNALATNYTFSFTTAVGPDTSLPMVNSTDPLNNATGVANNKVVSISFNKAMDPLTINNSTFTLMQGVTAVSGTVAYSGTTATFTPTNMLTVGGNYTATITTGAKDIAGNALATNTVWSFAVLGVGPATVNLRSAINYVILAKTAISNIPTSAITGNLGLSPAATSFVTGFGLTNSTGYATAPEITGKIYAADMAAPTGINLTTAVNDMMTAYTDAAGRPTPDFSELGTGNIGGQTLAPGLYKWTNTVTLPSSVTISGGANDIWIFQIAGDLTMSNAVNITLLGGAQPKNIFWQVAGTVNIGTGSHFEGIILSQTGITFQTGASMNGRALAQTAVILDANAITKP